MSRHSKELVFTPEWIALVNKANSGEVQTAQQICDWVKEAVVTKRLVENGQRCTTVTIYREPLQYGSRETMRELSQDFRDLVFRTFEAVKRERFKIAFFKDAGITVQYLESPIFNQSGICSSRAKTIRFVPMNSLTLEYLYV